MALKKQSVTISYYENLRFCTKTIADLYFKYQQYFPKEYLGLISNPQTPNGIIIRIPKIQPRDGVELKVLRVENYGKNFTVDELRDLTNAWVFLEDGQKPLQYLDIFFKYIIDELELSKYRIKQMYLDLELDEADDYFKDPDYTPHTDKEDYEEELEYESDNDLDQFDFKEKQNTMDDSDDDYVPSVESEDEYENTQKTYVAKKKPVKKYKKKPIH